MSNQSEAKYAYAPRVVEVYFVEPSPSSKDGYRTLGHFPMATVPRLGETVTIVGALGAEPSRFKIYDVIHHIPPTRLVTGEATEFVLSECTCVVSQDIQPADISEVINRLCKTTGNRIGTLPRPHAG
jgi:hypothetical protein